MVQFASAVFLYIIFIFVFPVNEETLLSYLDVAAACGIITLVFAFIRYQMVCTGAEYLTPNARDQVFVTTLQMERPSNECGSARGSGGGGGPALIDGLRVRRAARRLARALLRCARAQLRVGVSSPAQIGLRGRCNAGAITQLFNPSTVSTKRQLHLSAELYLYDLHPIPMSRCAGGTDRAVHVVREARYRRLVCAAVSPQDGECVCLCVSVVLHTCPLHACHS